MSSKWSDTGILRKRVIRDNFDDLLVFGYACKLFRDDERALYIDQGKHLIPWMADDGLKIDRYDGRGALSDLTSYEASREGYDATRWLGLADSDRKIEHLCDKERYYSLYSNEDEERIYKEEESKRQTSKKEFQYEYDQNDETVEPAAQAMIATCEEEDKPFVPAKKLNVPADIDIPKTRKENARIEKTALFVAQQGPQMEILIKAKQTHNPQFSFLNQSDPLQKYYRHLLSAIKAGLYDEIQEKVMQNGNDESDDKKDVGDMGTSGNDHYLHPSLAHNRTVSPPTSSTTLHYKPTADCAYSQLVSRIQGSAASDAQVDTANNIDPYYLNYQAHYYTYYQQIVQQYAAQGNCDMKAIIENSQLQEKIQQQAVQYAQAACSQYVLTQPQHQIPAAPKTTVASDEIENKVGGTRALVHYSSDSEEEEDECKDDGSLVVPPNDEALIIEKMAMYVAKNGPHFEQSVRDKGDPRFDFLNKSHVYFKFYKKRVQQLQCQSNESRIVSKKDYGKVHLPDVSSLPDKKSPVSFSIKKPKDDAPKDIRSALPAEESDEEKVSRCVSKPPSMDSSKGDTTSAPEANADNGDVVPEAVGQAPRVSVKTAVLEEDFIFEIIDLTEEKCGDQRVERRVRMSLAMRERALQLERRKRAALFVKMRSDSDSKKPSRTAVRAKRTDAHTEDLTHSDSELEEGEIRQIFDSVERKRKKVKKSSHRRRSKSRRNRSDSRQRKHKKRKYSSSSTSSSNH